MTDLSKSIQLICTQNFIFSKLKKKLQQQIQDEGLTNEESKDKKQNKLDHILSSVDLDYEEYKNKMQTNIEEHENKNNLKESLYFLVRFLISFAEYLFISYVVILLCFCVTIGLLIHKDWSSVMICMWGLICGSCTGYTLINYFFLEIENDYVRKLYQDGIFFIFSALLTFAYLKAHQKIESFVEEAKGSLTNVIQIPIHKDLSNMIHKLDYKNIYTDSLYELPQQINKQIQFFNVFGGKYNEDVIQNIIIEFQSFHAEENYSYQNFSILTLIILLKLAGVFYFINIHSLDMTVKDIVDMTLLILVYIYISYNLLRTLGSYDLIRKVNQMNAFKEMIDFYNITQENYLKKIDITSPESIEVFDNGRKVILNTQKDYLRSLELSYLCLVFYYFFVIIICLSYFFDFDWLIQKDSSLLNPLQVIMSTGNFVFLSAFLIFRFTHGTEFNNAFQELELSINHSLDLVEDLMTMYNSFFLEERRDIKVYERFSAYFLLTKKIKSLSRYYIENKIQFQDRIFEEKDKDQLRLLILRDMKKSLKKTKNSVQTDYQLHKYKFLNIVDVDVSSFLFTILIGVATSLPQIIPKFIVFFNKQ